MPSESLRIKKSRSMLWSLYSLAVAGLFVYALLIFATTLNLWSHFSLETVPLILKLAIKSLSFSSLSVVLALPFCISITFLSLFYRHSKYANIMEAVLRFVDRAPYILYGLFFLILFNGHPWSLPVIAMMVVIPKLSYRWIKLSKRVTELQVDTLKSIGFDVWSLIKILYLKRFFKVYLGHLFSMLCFLFTLVTPFLCFMPLADQLPNHFSVQLFNLLGRGAEGTAGMVVVLLLIHCFRVWFDTQVFYQEVENG